MFQLLYPTFYSGKYYTIKLARFLYLYILLTNQLILVSSIFIQLSKSISLSNGQTYRPLLNLLN